MSLYSVVSLEGGLLFVLGLVLILELDQMGRDAVRTTFVVFGLLTVVESLWILTTDLSTDLIVYLIVYNFGAELLVTTIWGPSEDVIRSFAVGYLFAWPLTTILFDLLDFEPLGLVFGLYVGGVGVVAFISGSLWRDLV